MRIRQIKPDYWRDRTLGTLAPAVREFYIGLWMEADDAGWLRWTVGEIGADLYPYRSPHRREADIEKYAAQLSEQGRVVIHDCGHAFIPTLTKHQKQAAGTRRVEAIMREHSGCQRSSAESSGEPLISGLVRNGKVGNGKVRNGSDSDDETTREVTQRLLDDPNTAPAVRKAAEKAMARLNA